MNSSAYQSAISDIAWRDISHFGRFRLSGRDAAALLHHLTTNDIKKLKVGEHCEAALITAKARLIDWLSIYREQDSFVVWTSPNRRELFAPHVHKFILFGQDVTIEDITETTRALAVFGPNAQDINVDLARVGGFQSARWPNGGWSLWSENQSDLQPYQRGANVDATTYNVLRIEAGLPVAGLELSEDFNPWEAGLNSSISLHKGCYNGQEIVARLNTYQKIKQHLRGLKIESDDAATWENATLHSAERNVGRVTSCVASPRFGTIALAYVRNDWAAPGNVLQVLAGENSAPATVGELPFGSE